QLRPELELGDIRPRLYHLREKDGRHEIDIVAEMGLNVVAAEIKATGAPALADAKHLLWLQDRLGESFLAGAVLHTGPYAFELAPNIFALPICVLWG
ncbi:MAG TPA: ATP-binding protein, partial [Chloroflexota bacterium]|nr:ATP-binding protein [Chloroflexota bacterium]